MVTTSTLTRDLSSRAERGTSHSKLWSRYIGMNVRSLCEILHSVQDDTAHENHTAHAIAERLSFADLQKTDCKSESIYVDVVAGQMTKVEWHCDAGMR